jgi:hypothetical protein
MTEQPQIASRVFFSPAVNMQIQTFAFSTLPGTVVPRGIAARGVTTADDQTAEPALVIAFDFPQQSADAVTKWAQEARDVDAFLRDLLPAGRITSASIVNPNDPPDVLAHIDGNEVGIEAAQFLPPDSELDKSNSIAGRWMSFESFRDKVLEQAPNTLAQHRGLLVVMHFGGQSDASAAERLPPRRANLGSAIAAIRAAQPIVQEAPHGRSYAVERKGYRSVVFRQVSLLHMDPVAALVHKPFPQPNGIRARVGLPRHRHADRSAE